MTGPWEKIVAEATELRRALHRRPELTWSEEETARTIRTKLDQCAIPWRACAGTGTVCTLARGAAGRHIALRADIDALPIAEATGAPWTSEIDGCMHACGHDGHTATLYAVAQWLKLHEAALPGPVTLLFQPAEEGGHGAKRMIEDGALEGVEAIFGWHNWPAIPFGQALCPDGPVMAANGTFEIQLHGQGGHASQPELCRDPVLAAAAVTMALQHVVSRRLPPQAATVVSVTSIEAPGGVTTIPDTAVLRGSVRLSDTSLRDELSQLITQTATDTARAYGTIATVTTHPRYGATVNHPEEARRFRDIIASTLGASWNEVPPRMPVMASEDFSYYLDAIPGAFALIGANDGPHHGAPCHSALYDFNDALIPIVTELYARLAGAPVPPSARGAAGRYSGPR